LQLPPGDYKIRVEGNHAQGQGGTIFTAESALKFSEKFLSILIQTNRYIYTGGQASKLVTKKSAITVIVDINFVVKMLHVLFF